MLVPPRGTCQVCGAVAAVRHGLMALHSAPQVVTADSPRSGGLCQGSGEPPVEGSSRGVESAVVKGLY